MKVQELLEDRKRQQKLDVKNFRLDYLRWKKLINMPTRIVRVMARETDTTLRGMTKRELQKRYGFIMPTPAAKALLRLRMLPVKQWTTVEINWMYRMLQYVEKKLTQRIPLVNNDGKPTEQLRDLWAWGHVPRNLRPTNKGLRETVELFDADDESLEGPER